MPRESKPRLPPRERLMQAAETLFYQQGILRVTVDAIAEKAESTKMTLYRHFASKDAMVLEWIRLLTEDYSSVFGRAAEQHPNDAAAQILYFTRFITDNLNETLHRGCPFTNTLAEAGTYFPEAKERIVAHKQNQFRQLATLCEQAGADDALTLAKEITLMLEGAQVVAQNSGFSDVAEFTWQSIQTKLQAATR